MADTPSYTSPLLVAEDKRVHGEDRFLPCAAFRGVSFCDLDIIGWLGVAASKMFAALLRKSAAADLVRRARNYPAPCCRKYMRGRYWHAGDDPSSDAPMRSGARS
jgi:hypothetical protein